MISKNYFINIYIYMVDYRKKYRRYKKKYKALQESLRNQQNPIIGSLQPGLIRESNPDYIREPAPLLVAPRPVVAPLLVGSPSPVLVRSPSPVLVRSPSPVLVRSPFAPLLVGSPFMPRVVSVEDNLYSIVAVVNNIDKQNLEKTTNILKVKYSSQYLYSRYNIVLESNKASKTELINKYDSILKPGSVLPSFKITNINIEENEDKLIIKIFLKSENLPESSFINFIVFRNAFSDKSSLLQDCTNTLNSNNIKVDSIVSITKVYIIDQNNKIVL